jgi:hypothetical protein
MKYSLLGVGLASLFVSAPAWSRQDDNTNAPPPAKEEAPPPANAATPPPEGPLTSALELVHVEPFVTIVGGLKLDTIIQGPTETRQGRISAIGLSDFGLRGNIGKHVSFVSELMFNAGTDLHGSSTWEGQAELQVRQQLIHVEGAGFTGEVGRVIDEGSVNFVSNHIGDALFQDYATEQPLLYSGFNLGNGVRGTYEVVKGLRVGFTFTAGNPTSTSAALQVGGSFPPFNRFYIQPYQAVQQSASNVPDDTFDMMVFSPALLFTHKYIDARAEFQGYTVNTNTNTNAAQPITGFNVRGGVKVKIADELVTPFANIAVDQNDTVNPANVAQIAAVKYTSVVLTGGIDLNLHKVAPGRFDGIGAQYDLVEYQVGSACNAAGDPGCVTYMHFVNVGASYWFNPWLCAGARFSMWLQHGFDQSDEGERSGLLTLRLVI